MKIDALRDSAFFAITCLATPAAGQVRHHDWTTAISNDRSSISASNVNADGSILMETCTVQSKTCFWIMGGSTVCEKGVTSPALVNSDKYAGSTELNCVGDIGDGLYAYAFADWKSLERLIKDSKYVGIAVAIGDTQFKVFRFSLVGMAAAQRHAEKRFRQMLEQDSKAARPQTQPVGETIL